jgi:hypothetical protein
VSLFQDLVDVVALVAAHSVFGDERAADGEVGEDVRNFPVGVEVVRPEVAALLVERVDVRNENRQGERVEATALCAAAPGRHWGGRAV